MLTIDGSLGEGGGQVLRTSLAMSLLTGTPFRILNIRAKRKKPGLMRQHLTAANAAATLGHAEVEGAQLGSQSLSFHPGTVRPGEYSFATGSAGSTTLVTQTILPPLLCADGPSNLTLEGGTHNPYAPPFEFLKLAFLPLVARMGPRIEAGLEARGFYPAGGGRCIFSITPSAQVHGLELLHRGDVSWIHATAVLSALPRHIADREIGVLENALGTLPLVTQIEEVNAPRGPGNVVIVVVECTNVTEVFTAFGRVGVRAETVAQQVANEVTRYLDADVPVGTHLADQLLVPLAMAGRGAFRTLEPSTHTRTNMDVIQRFLPVEFRAEQSDEKAWEITVQSQEVTTCRAR